MTALTGRQDDGEIEVGFIILVQVLEFVFTDGRVAHDQMLCRDFLGAFLLQLCGVSVLVLLLILFQVQLSIQRVDLFLFREHSTVCQEREWHVDTLIRARRIAILLQQDIANDFLAVAAEDSAAIHHAIDVAKDRWESDAVNGLI